MTRGTRLAPAHVRGSHDRAAVAAPVPAHVHDRDLLVPPRAVGVCGTAELGALILVELAALLVQLTEFVRDSDASLPAVPAGRADDEHVLCVPDVSAGCQFADELLVMFGNSIALFPPDSTIMEA
jgi:hypothetical protein